jgi:hypothetical protein
VILLRAEQILLGRVFGNAMAVLLFDQPDRAPGSLHRAQEQITHASLTDQAEVCDGAPHFSAHPFILLSNQHSGSTWVNERLGTRDKIEARGELLGSWHKSLRGRHVSWPEFREQLEHSFEFGAALPATHAFGFKLQYNQVPAHLLAPFVAWLGCVQVSVVQLVRTASLEVYLSYVSHAVEKVVNGNNDRLRPGSEELAQRQASIANASRPLTLSASAAAVYVHAVEQEVAAFEFAFRYQHRVPHLQVFYEPLRAPPTRHRAWAALLGFLLPDAVTGSMHDTIIKKHSSGCACRVANWPEVSAALKRMNATTLAACASLDRDPDCSSDSMVYLG